MNGVNFFIVKKVKQVNVVDLRLNQQYFFPLKISKHSALRRKRLKKIKWFMDLFCSEYFCFFLFCVFIDRIYICISSKQFIYKHTKNKRRKFYLSSLLLFQFLIIFLGDLSSNFQHFFRCNRTITHKNEEKNTFSFARMILIYCRPLSGNISMLMRFKRKTYFFRFLRILASNERLIRESAIQMHVTRSFNSERHFDIRQLAIA